MWSHLTHLEICDVFAVLLQRVDNGRLEVVNRDEIREEGKDVFYFDAETGYLYQYTLFYSLKVYTVPVYPDCISLLNDTVPVLSDN